MKVILLAAGYAKRLRPLTTNFPKPLLPIAGKPMLEHILEKVQELPGITGIYVVTNEKFHKDFENWAEGKNITVINDKTTNNEDRLGAIGDIQYTIEQAGIDEDLLVVGGDNLFKFSLSEAHSLFKDKQKPVIIAYDVLERELAKKYGVLDINEENKVVSFVEKPEEPASTNCSTCIYFYPKMVLPKIKEYIDEGNNADQPGRLIAWFVDKDEVYGMSHKEQWYDVGGFESLAEAKKDYGEANVDVEKLREGILD